MNLLIGINIFCLRICGIEFVRLIFLRYITFVFIPEHRVLRRVLEIRCVGITGEIRRILEVDLGIRVVLEDSGSRFFIEEEDGVVTKKGRKTLDKECNWESSHEEEYGHFEEDGVLYHVRITDEHYDYPENGRFD